jgi:hypothetical protein
MQLTHWLPIIPAIQSGWSLAAFTIFLLYLYSLRK